MKNIFTSQLFTLGRFLNNYFFPSLVFLLISSGVSAAPYVSVSFSPNPVKEFLGTKLEWSSSGAVSCTGAPTARTTDFKWYYPTANDNGWQVTITCIAADNSTSTATATLSVIPAPALELTASFSPTTVAPGQLSKFSWYSNASTCSSPFDDWYGAKDYYPTSNTTVYITCKGAGGREITKSATVNVTASAPKPTVDASFSSSTINSGDSVNLNWSSTNATGCTIDGTPRNVSGPLTYRPTSNLTVRIICSGAGGTADTSASVNVVQPVVTPTAPPAPSITATSADIFSSARTFTIDWTNTGATTYYVEYAGSSANNITSNSSWVLRYSGLSLRWVETMSASFPYNQWRVKACNSVCSAWVYSRTKTFQERSVTSYTTLTSPTDGMQIWFANGEPCFQWQVDPLATEISVTISNTSDFPEKRWVKVLPAGSTGTCWNGGASGGWEQKGTYPTEMPTLSFGSTFYWRVVSTLPIGLSYTPTRSFTFTNTPPSPAVPVLSGQILPSGQLELKWPTPSGSVGGYALWYVTGGEGYNLSNGTNSYITSNFGTYEIKACVIPSNSATCSAYSQRVTVAATPPAPASISAIVDNGNWSITWAKPDSSVTSYNIVEINGGTTRNYSGLTTNSYKPTVAGSTQYTIAACNSNGCGPSVTQTFALTAAPTAPSITAMAADVFSSARNFTVNWTNTGATTYYVEYAGSSASNITASSSWIPRYSGAALQWIEPMSSSYAYNQWRVKACNSVCSAWAYSRTQVFQLQAVTSSTTLISPTDGAQASLIGNNPCFQWQVDPAATEITVTISNNTDFPEKRWHKVLPAGSTNVCWNGGAAGGWEQKGAYAIEMPTLSFGSTFYWRVVSTMPAGLSYTPTRSFTLTNTPAAPGVPVLSGRLLPNGQAELSWPTPSGAVGGYALWYVTGGEGYNISAGVNSYVTSKFGTYEIKACAIVTDNSTCSAYSQRVTVTSAPSAPASISATIDNGNWLIAWPKPNGAVTSYNVVETNGGTTRFYNGLTTNSYRPTVTGSTQYTITACNSNGCGTSITQTFMLTAGPSAPSVTATAADVFSSARTFTIDWTNTGATTYNVEYAGSSVNDIGTNSNWISRYSGTALRWVETMSSSMVYNQWRVRACNSVCSPWIYSRIKIFQALAVTSSTTLTSPADNSQALIAGVNPCFQWQVDPAATEITVTISNSTDFPEKRWHKVLSAGSTSACWNGGVSGGWEQKGIYPTEVPALATGSTFYWRVVSTMPTGLAYTGTRSFTLTANSVVSEIIQAENYAAMSGVLTQSSSDTGGGQNVYNLTADDWISYSNKPINIPVAGLYKVTYRVATWSGNSILVLKEDSTNAVLDTATLPNTAGWQTWVDVVRQVNLSQGTHTFKLYATSGNINLNWFRVENSTPAGPVTQKYVYDALGRLTFVEDNQNGNRDYDYDAAGNRTSVSANVPND